MPWLIEPKDDQFCVVVAETNEQVGCHDTPKEAIAHLQALYANVEEKADFYKVLRNALKPKDKPKDEPPVAAGGPPTPSAADRDEPPQKARGLRVSLKDGRIRIEGEFVGDKEQPTDESAIVYGLVWCPHKKDRQGDEYGEEKLAQTIAAFRKDIDDGLCLEMGVNHEGEPCEQLKALALEQASADVEIGGLTFHAADWVLKAELFGERLAAFKRGDFIGFSLEGVEDDEVPEIAEEAKAKDSGQGGEQHDSPPIDTPPPAPKLTIEDSTEADLARLVGEKEARRMLSDAALQLRSVPPDSASLLGTTAQGATGTVQSPLPLTIKIEAGK